MSAGMRPTTAWTLALVLLAGIGVSEGEGQTKRLLVVKFQDKVSGPFRNHERFKRFAADLPNFSDEFVLQMHSSKAVDLDVVPHEKNIGSHLMEGYGHDVKSKELRAELLELCRTDSFKSHYYLIGRISDDTSNIVFVDGEVYERFTDTMRDPLRFRFHVEGSHAEAFRKKTSLANYLIEKLVLKIEAGLDERIRVLITPFRFYGRDPGIERLGGMISSLLSNGLTISQRIRVITLDTAFSWAGFRQSTLPELGRREAARYVIGGSFFKYGTSVGIEADHIDVETGHSVLSKSILIDSVTGHEFYDKVNLLGDGIRRAIELDYDIRRKEKRITIAVVAAPPYPGTEENTSIALEVAGTVARMLKQLEMKGEAQLSVITGEFVSRETENAVIGRDLNTQYLWVVQCERPGRDFNLKFELSDVKNPHLRDNWSCFGIPMERLNDSIHSMVIHLLTSPKSIKRFVDTVDTASLKRIVFIPPEMSVAVVPLPPYPNTVENRAIATDIAHIVTTKLGTVQILAGQLHVVRTEHLFQDFLERAGLDIASVAKEVDARYVWLIDYKELGLERLVYMQLANAANPFDTVFSTHFPVDHIDKLNHYVGEKMKSILTSWLPGLDTMRVKKGSGEDDSAEKVIDRLNASSHRTESASIRVRSSVIGFLEDYKAVFSKYHYAIEVAGIYHIRPWQFELVAAYDFGKRRSNPDRLTYGRYVTGLVRYNFPITFLLRDMRVYLGVGPTLFNVVRVKDGVWGALNGGYSLAGGFEIPFSRYVFLDLNTQFLKPLEPSRLGSASPDDFSEDFITAFSLGVGLGVRIR